MTVMAERMSQMQVEEFEEIASKAPGTVMLEFIDGRIGVFGETMKLPEPVGIELDTEIPKNYVR